MMIIRPATRDDIETFSKLRNKPTILAWVGDIDGRIAGIAGFARSGGRWYGFCDLHDEARPYKITIARAARLAMQEAKRRGIRFAYAQTDQNEPGAERWLTSLGFRIDPRTPSLYRWNAQCLD